MSILTSEFNLLNGMLKNLRKFIRYALLPTPITAELYRRIETIEAQIEQIRVLNGN